MDRCNVTGKTDGKLFKFQFNNEFGFNSKYPLDAGCFTFKLCKQEFDSLWRKGTFEIANDEREDYTYQHGKWFSSEQIYDLISRFQYVPKGYYRDSYSTFTDEEEQLFWDNMDKKKSELLTPERVEELAYVLHGEQ